jgi:hypothetical protein
MSFDKTIVLSVSVLANCSYVQFYIAGNVLHNYQAQVRRQASQREFCWGIYGTCTVFFLSISFLQCYCHSTNIPYLHIKTTPIRRSGGPSQEPLKKASFSQILGSTGQKITPHVYFLLYLSQYIHKKIPVS